ncbi:MAG: type IV pilin N-terminal domain-containing protein [Candidatus Methanoperedens sp.]|nr:type IV pilin N-terminal domain-containing protein [Candidatus Methanoperedens sp.]
MKNRMKITNNDEAVSPVIGVILMVAITVILAAVIAAFVFGMGTPTKTPTVNMQLVRAQVGTGQITLTHSGGETVTLADVKLIVYSNSSYKTTVNPLLEFGNTTALPAGSELKLNFTSTGIDKILIDGNSYTNLGTKTPTTASATSGYLLNTAGQAVTIEFWYVPSGQLLGKVQGATIQ